MENNFRPCWILSSERVGSTYLCGLLNSTGLFYNPEFKQGWHEYYLHRFLKKEYTYNPPIINKLHYWQYKKCLENVNINDILPNIRYVLLRRRDTVSSAISKYFIRSCQHIDGIDKWNIYNKKDFKTMQGNTAPFNKRKILDMYNQMEYDYDSWMNYLADKQFIEFDYEDLYSDPTNVTEAILEYMGLKGSPNLKDENLSMKLDHPQKKEFVKKLRHIVSTKITQL